MPWDRDNVVEGNHIYHIDGIMGDGGAIYTLGVREHSLQAREEDIPALAFATADCAPLLEDHGKLGPSQWVVREAGARSTAW
jgi:hypothetical protein